jgi:uncharacterized cupin superfamily protein
MVEEARLETVASGLAPASDGWFVLNVGEAAWLVNDAFGARCVFEGDVPVLRSRPELGVHRFGEVGLTLAVLRPGCPSTLYHAESAQEDFLVLAGQCLLIVQGRERRLEAWDFVHCPPGTGHAFVGTGDGPCVLLMIGARPGGKEIAYPAEPAAAAHGAAAAAATTSAREAYANHPHWTLGRPDGWDALPWASRP